MREILPPTINPETAAFWAGASQKKLLIGRCNACGEPHYYPRRHCPFCLSPDVALVEAEGNARLHSFSVMRRAPVPYACGYVALAEGPMMLCDIVTDHFDSLQIGMELRLTFLPIDGGLLPAFAPATDKNDDG